MSKKVSRREGGCRWKLEGVPTRRVTWPRISCVWSIEQVSSRRRAKTRCCSDHNQVRYLHDLVSLERWTVGISWKGVLVIHIIMGRGRLKGVKDSLPRTVNTTQKSKHNKGDNGGTTVANGERPTTLWQCCVHWAKWTKRVRYPRLWHTALHQENVISNEQLNRQRVRERRRVVKSWEREVCSNKPFLEFPWCDVILRVLHGYGTVKQRDKPTKTKWERKGLGSRRLCGSIFVTSPRETRWVFQTFLQKKGHSTVFSESRYCTWCVTKYEDWQG